MKSIELLDSWISRTARSWSSRLGGDARTPELLEIRRELLNHVRDQVQAAGGGRFVFPYRRIYVHLAAGSEVQRQLLEGAFTQSNDLEQDFAALLSEAGCVIPEGFSVEATVVEDAALAATTRPFRIDYSSAKIPHSKAGEVTRRAARLTVVRGEAEPHEYVIRSDRTNLGRLKEVISETGAVRRRNDVAFAESETTVSREHAYVTYNREIAAYCLHDSRNQRGTSVLRESRELRVPRGSTRGLDLQSGDEIHLGNARLRFEVEPLPPEQDAD